MQSTYQMYLVTECGYSPHTVETNLGELAAVEKWLGEQGAALDTANPDQLRAFIRWRSAQPRGCAGTILRYISTMRSYFAFIGRREVGAQLEGPGTTRRVPLVPNVAEVSRLIDAASSLRDAALLELLYATGARATEIAEARIADLDVAGRTIRLFGKGRKERQVPVSRAALGKLQLYLGTRGDLRPVDLLFVTTKGNHLTRRMIYVAVRRAARRSNQRVKKISPHTLRHAFATHLLCSGRANLRQIQDWLGHSYLDTTAVYLHLDIEHAKRIIHDLHPRERQARGLPLEIPAAELKPVA